MSGVAFDEVQSALIDLGAGIGQAQDAVNSLLEMGVIPEKDREQLRNLNRSFGMYRLVMCDAVCSALEPEAEGAEEE